MADKWMMAGIDNPNGAYIKVRVETYDVIKTPEGSKQINLRPWKRFVTDDTVQGRKQLREHLNENLLKLEQDRTVWNKRADELQAKNDEYFAARVYDKAKKDWVLK